MVQLFRTSVFILMLWVMYACKSSNNPNNMQQEKHSYTNALIHETSPYLLQHAHNPVDWQPWNEEVLERAQKENKPLLISIGYSACHWCHVMEHESFEDTAVAKLMNEHFICIKVDREERPDVDQVYMDAVQLLTRQGGWPLNCFALPDGKPFYGGTYFPKAQWTEVLTRVAQQYAENRSKIEEVAQQLTEGVAGSDLIEMNNRPSHFHQETLDVMIDRWEDDFDNIEGGPDRAPKFPLPNNYEFLLQFGELAGDVGVLKHVDLTLTKMAYGGIYDQLGGGFARYSVDELWKVPHFEKMLYDNGQLVSLYTKGYQKFQKPLYRQIVEETLAFVEREMYESESGAFYSALDADSEGEEGKFYVWKSEEVKTLLGDDYELVKAYYNIEGKGYWEEGNNILLRSKSDEELATEFGITTETLNEKIDKAKLVLTEVRGQRVRPGLDDKSLTSWNALMLKGYADAYRVFQEERFLEIALKNAAFISSTMRKDDNGLWHSYKKGEVKINGYLEDYAFTIEAFIALYQATFDEKWLIEAKTLADYAIVHFFNKENGMFYFTSSVDNPLIARKTEIMDNVIPSTNSAMAKVLYQLGIYIEDQRFLEMSEQMLNNVQMMMSKYGSSFSNWGILMNWLVFPHYEVVFTGEKSVDQLHSFTQHYIPNALLAGSKTPSTLALLQNRVVNGKSLIYVCQNKACKLPVETVEEALEQVK
tara:strand:+ start:5129 stop:7243 length:2115 start_codon:yes stop_codon:yes gene_type:complete